MDLHGLLQEELYFYLQEVRSGPVNCNEGSVVAVIYRHKSSQSLCALSVRLFQTTRSSQLPIAPALLPSSVNQWTSQNRGKTWFRKLDCCLPRNNWGEHVQCLRFLIEFIAMEVYQQWRSSGRCVNTAAQCAGCLQCQGACVSITNDNF
jgi:hypothetical protein